MARVTQRCPECRAEVPLSPAVEGNDVKCPECGAWFAARSSLAAATPSRWPREDEVPHPAEEGHSNTALWIGLGIGGGLFLLLVVCGGIGAFVWLLSSQRQSRMQAQVAFRTAGAQPLFAAPTEFPPQTEDYAEARKNFQTKLVQEEAAPQRADPNRIALAPDAKEIEYMSGGLRLKAWVSKPADEEEGKKEGKKPAVLFLHDGFAFGSDDWQMAAPFREAGYVVMIPMLRGENDLPGAYSMFYNEVDDVLAAADQLEKLPYVDPKRVYLAGHSSGATLVLLTAMTTSRFRAAAAFSGSPDQTNWAVVLSNLGGYAGDGIAAVPFDEGNAKEFQMRSPLAFPGSFKCPVRLYFGNQETYLKTTNQKLAELAKEKKLDVEAVEVGGDHRYSVPNAMPLAIEFFQKH
jgi:dienelactone hydrolase